MSYIRGFDGISVIVVTYKPGSELLKCIDSLFSCINSRFELIVVDNSPSRPSVFDQIDGREGVKIVHSGGNVGFGRANNIGAKEAKYEYLLLINPDAYITTAIDDPDSYFESDTGIVSARCVDELGEYKQTVGYFPVNPKLLIKFSRRLRSDSGFDNGIFLNKSYVIDYAEGSFYFVRKSTFNLVGGFDESIFLYGEDYELSYRISRRGFFNVYRTDLSYGHPGGYVDTREPYIVKGLLYFSRKHLTLMRSLQIRLVLLSRYIMLSLVGIVGFIRTRERGRLNSAMKSLYICLKL